MATVLALAVVHAGEPASTLLGANRDQVIQRLGEPRSQMAGGNRVVMFFARERVVLRDGVVVEVERIAAEPGRKSAPVASAAPATPAASPAPTAGEHHALATPASVIPVPAASAAKAPTPEATQSVPTDPVPAPVLDPVPPPEPKLEIKSVRPPSPGSPRPQMQVRTKPREQIPLGAATPSLQPTPPPSSVSAPASVAPAARSETPIATKVAVAAPQISETAVSPPARPVVQTRPTPIRELLPEVVAPVAEEQPARDDAQKREEELAAAAAQKKAKLVKASRRRLDAAVENPDLDPSAGLFTTQTFVIIAVIVVGGVGLLWWQRRQRELEMEASALSHTPFNAPAGGVEGDGAQFEAEFLARLEWKRFEELVEAYYSKTGVVAVRTKGGPASPAQIKISWKGEPQPFALVRCIPHSDDLIEIKPLQELFTLLAAEDIRRGYVVTPGRFSVAARDYAAEKHLTLLSGDLFLEKLNALPGAARTEIMQTAAAGDSSVPSCPTCEAKLTRTNDSPPVWRCAAHPEVSFPVRD